MGQKTHPQGFRLILRKNWDSQWYAPKAQFATQLHEDLAIRKFLSKKSACQGASRFLVRRLSDKIEVVIHTARPGLVIGKKGQEIEVLKQELKKFTGKDVYLEVEEIKRPDLDATLVANAIATQFERRLAWRRVLKKAIQSSMDAGAAGIKIVVSGRIGGAEIARTEWYKEGKVSLHTLRNDIDYAQGRAETTYGSIGIKVWINRGEMKAAPQKPAATGA
ncbi:MAG: 30S ribosomal protein S3 [Chlamydiae bacterium]|nr:30S ribosomal protein S3 [Chlamydiota bacterium]